MNPLVLTGALCLAAGITLIVACAIVQVLNAKAAELNARAAQLLHHAGLLDVTVAGDGE